MASAASMTQADAWKRYSKLLFRIEQAPRRDDHFKRFLSVAESVLKAHPIDESTGTDPCVVDPAEDVVETLSDLLDAPSTIFGDDYFTSAFYPLRLLFDVANFYSIQSVDAAWYMSLNLLDTEQANKKVTTTAWLCHLLKMEASETRLLLEEYKASRKLTTNIGSQATTLIANPEVPTASASDPPSTAVAGAASAPAATSRQGDVTPATADVESPSLGIASDAGVDTGRADRLDRLRQRGGQNTMSASERMKQSSYVNYYFTSKQFTGDLAQSIDLTLRDYYHCATLFDMDDGSMATNFASALGDPARAFFLSKVQPGMKFKEIEAFMIAEYNSNSRQVQVRRKLEALRIDAIMSEKGLASEQEALTAVINIIDTLIPQCPPAFRGEENKISFLRHAVIRHPWATNAVAKVDAGDVKWTQFTTDLHAAISLRREVDDSTPMATHFGDLSLEEAFDTFMTRYGRDPRFTRKHDHPSTSTHASKSQTSKTQRYRPDTQLRITIPSGQSSITFEEARRRNLCVRCTKPWKPGHRCAGRHVRDRVYDKIRKGVHHTHIIAELASALEAQGHDPLSHEEQNHETPADESHDTHVVEEEIKDIEAFIENETADANECDKEFATHFLAASFPHNTPTSHDPVMPRSSPSMPYVTERREYVSDVSRTYLTAEAKRLSKPGFLVDIGAPKSVVGKKALNRILTAMGNYHRPPLRKSANSFRFADESFSSHGIITLHLETPRGVTPIAVDIDIVKADIPPLLGLDVIDRERLTPDVAYNVLAKRRKMLSPNGTTFYVEDWSIPMWRASSRHSYVPLSVSAPTYFTRTQLHKLHRQFFHPSADKLYNLLKRSRPDDTTPETREVLKDITKRCVPCQKMRRGPTRFRVSLGAEDVRFNERVLMDIMYLGNSPVLHVVDEQTKFSAAAFLTKVSTDEIWRTFLKCWATIYTGLPNRMMVDQGKQLGQSGILAAIAATSNVKLETTGIEAHSSLGLGERYHQPLRNTYRKLQHSHPSADKELLLQYSVKSMNDTLGPEGIVPSVLVFGEYPPAYTPSETRPSRPTNDERAKIAHEARVEMSHQMAKVRVARALKHAVPSAADETFSPGDKVLVWREKIVNNRIGEWMGPFVVDSYEADKKLVFVQCEKGEVKPFGLVQVRRYYEPEVTAYSLFTELNNSLSYFREPAVNVHATEVLTPSDSKATSIEMDEAKKKEIRGLLSRGTFKVIMREDVPPNANILPGRFVLAIKSTEDGKEKYKARFVMGGHRDKFKHMMVHNSATLQPQSIRLLLAIARANGFHVWTADVTQAYLQSTDPLLRDIYVTKPVPEFELEPEQCLKLMKPLYGLCDAGDLWASTMDKHHRQNLDMTPLRSEPALYTKHSNGSLMGLSGSYVDDLLRAGTDEFRKLCRATHEKFDMGDEEPIPGPFTGFYIGQDESGDMLQHQTSYLKQLETLPSNADFTMFRSMRMKLAWLAHTRADCMFEISQLAQVTSEAYSKDRGACIRRLNKAVTYAVDNKVAIRIPKVDLRTAKVVGFSDASFANNADLSNQLGHVVFLVDASGNSVPIAFKSYKARRVVRSAMAGEVIAFSDMFDVAVTLAEELRVILSRSIPLHLLTDSKALFDVISKGTKTSEKRLMLDIAAAREGFRDKVISDIGFVRSSHNLADGLTKQMQQAALREGLVSGRLDTTVEQWIIRA